MMLPLALSRLDVASYVQMLIWVYAILIFVNVVASFFPRIPYSRPMNAVLTFVRETTDPYLNVFRRFLPAARLGPAALDLSPLIGTLVLFIVGGFVVSVIAGG